MLGLANMSSGSLLITILLLPVMLERQVPCQPLGLRERARAFDEKTCLAYMRPAVAAIQRGRVGPPPRQRGQGCQRSARSVAATRAAGRRTWVCPNWRAPQCSQCAVRVLSADPSAPGAAAQLRGGHALRFALTLMHAHTRARMHPHTHTARIQWATLVTKMPSRLYRSNPPLSECVGGWGVALLGSGRGRKGERRRGREGRARRGGG